MPLIYLGGDIFYQGTQVDFNTLSLYASFYAGSIRSLDLELRSTPPIFFPINPTPDSLWLFLFDFAEAFQELVLVIEN